MLLPPCTLRTSRSSGLNLADNRHWAETSLDRALTNPRALPRLGSAALGSQASGERPPPNFPTSPSDLATGEDERQWQTPSGAREGGARTLTATWEPEQPYQLPGTQCAWQPDTLPEKDGPRKDAAALIPKQVG